MSRWKAAAIHLSVSAVIAAVLLGLIYFVLYPYPLFRAMGGSEIAILVIMIDVVLGPILTCVVFKSGKRTLKFDLTVIAILQISALVYGMSIVWRARPVFIVAREDVAYAIPAHEIDAVDYPAAEVPEFRSAPLWGPKVARLERPTDQAELNQLLDTYMSSGRDIQMMPKYYREWTTQPPDTLQHAIALEDLLHRKPQYQPVVDRWMKRQGRTVNNARCLSLLTRHEELCLMLDAKDGRYLGVLDIDPS